MNTLCQTCKGCCCRFKSEARKYKHISVTQHDIKRIAKHFEISYENAEQVFTNHGKLPEKTNGDCYFLKDNICLIHPARPSVCRNFEVGGKKCISIRKLFGM